MTDGSPITIKENGLILSLHIQPKSSKNSVVGIYNGAFKLKIKAPPVDGAANKEIIKFVSKLIKVKKNSIKIVMGQTSKQKKIYIDKPKDQSLKEFEKKVLTFFK